MNLRTKDKSKILLENFCDVEIVVTTPRSKYRDKIYNLTDADWRARVSVSSDRSKDHIAYYYWDAIKLSDTSEEKFADLIKGCVQYDSLGKEICANNLLFSDGIFYKVEFTTANYIYLTDYDISVRGGNHYMGVLKSFNSYLEEFQYWRLNKSNTYRFLLIDNPLDILRIVNENR